MSYGNMSEREKALIVSEVNILRELRHPHIVRYMDRIIDKRSSKIYIMMEYCQGGDLGRIIKRRKRERRYFEEHRIWKLFSQLLMAFEECHLHKEGDKHRPILHRDVKPGNILIDALGNAKLGDFGLAKELTSESRFAYTNVGTPYYMPPEMVNETKYNEKVDIWSIGCLIFEMAALRPPFEAKNVVALGAKINAGVFERIPAIFSDQLQQTIVRMLRTNPAQRPSVTELLKLPNVAMLVNEVRMAERKQQLTSELNHMLEDVKAREAKVDQREREVAEREYAVSEQESRLQQRMMVVQQREQEHAKAVAAFEVLQQEHRCRLSSMASSVSASSYATSSTCTMSTGTTVASSTLTPLSSGSLARTREGTATCERCGSAVNNATAAGLEDCVCMRTATVASASPSKLVASLSLKETVQRNTAGSPTHSMASSTMSTVSSSDEEVRSIQMQWSAPRATASNTRSQRRPHEASMQPAHAGVLTSVLPSKPRQANTSGAVAYSSPATTNTASVLASARRMIYETPPAGKQRRIDYFDENEDEKENSDANGRPRRGRSHSRQMSPAVSPSSSLRGTGRPRSPVGGRPAHTESESEENTMLPPAPMSTAKRFATPNVSASHVANSSSSNKRRTLQRTRPRRIDSSTNNTGGSRSAEKLSSRSQRRTSLAPSSDRVSTTPSSRTSSNSIRRQQQQHRPSSGISPSSASSVVSGASHKTSLSVKTTRSRTSDVVTGTSGGRHRRQRVGSATSAGTNASALEPSRFRSRTSNSNDGVSPVAAYPRTASPHHTAASSARVAARESSHSSNRLRHATSTTSSTTRKTSSSARSVTSNVSSSSGNSAARSAKLARNATTMDVGAQHRRGYPSIRSTESGDMGRLYYPKYR
jgi:serine/threonine protein kinase